MEEPDSPSEGQVKKEERNVETKEVPHVTAQSHDFPSIPEGFPPDVKRAIEIMRVTSMGGPSPNPLFEKFTYEHVHKYLDYVQRDDDNLFKLRSSSRWFHCFYALLGVSSFLFLVIFLVPIDKVLLSDIIKILVSFAGGLGSGFGLKAYLDKK